MFTVLNSLRKKIVASVGLLVFVALFSLSWGNVYSARKNAMATMKSQTIALTLAHAEGVAEWVKSRQQVVRSFATAVNEAQPLKYLEQAKIAGGVDLAYIGYADKRIAFSEMQNLPPGYDPTARPWYQQAAAASGPIVTEPYVDAASKKLVITIASAVKEGGQVKAVTALDAFMDNVVRNVASVRPTPGTYAFIVSKSGKIVVHENAGVIIESADTDNARRGTGE